MPVSRKVYRALDSPLVLIARCRGPLLGPLWANLADILGGEWAYQYMTMAYSNLTWCEGEAAEKATLL